jgi:hypothetical protein
MIKPDIGSAVISSVRVRRIGAGEKLGRGGGAGVALILGWTTVEHGFGELILTFDQATGDWEMETECLGREFAGKVLAWVAEKARVTE